jgi:hypothetical protein
VRCMVKRLQRMDKEASASLVCFSSGESSATLSLPPLENRYPGFA